jgi:hypothetical protein
VITGSWLPYKTYRKAKLDYFEIYNFPELSEKLDVIIDNFDNEKEMMLKNKQSIRDYFISESVAKNWSQILS